MALPAAPLSLSAHSVAHRHSHVGFPTVRRQAVGPSPVFGRTGPLRADNFAHEYLNATYLNPFNFDYEPPDMSLTPPKRKRQTLLRVVLPSLVAGVGAALIFPAISLFLKTFLDAGELSILGNDSSQFVQNFVTVNGLLFSILAGNTYYFLYQQTENMYYALYSEVSEAKSLLEQTTLVCQGRPFYQDVLRNIQEYIAQDLRRLDQPPAVLLSTKPSNDPLESILYMTSVGVPSIVYETVRSLRQARAYRLGAMQRKLPEIHFIMLYVLAAFELFTFPFLGAGTSSLFSNSILSVQAIMFGCLTGSLVLTTRVMRELWVPRGGAYNVDSVLETMVRGLELETEARLAGGTFSNQKLPSPPPSFNPVDTRRLQPAPQPQADYSEVERRVTSRTRGEEHSVALVNELEQDRKAGFFQSLRDRIRRSPRSSVRDV